MNKEELLKMLESLTNNERFEMFCDIGNVYCLICGEKTNGKECWCDRYPDAFTGHD